MKMVTAPHGISVKRRTGIAAAPTRATASRRTIWASATTTDGVSSGTTKRRPRGTRRRPTRSSLRPATTWAGVTKMGRGLPPTGRWPSVTIARRLRAAMRMPASGCPSWACRPTAVPQRRPRRHPLLRHRRARMSTPRRWPMPSRESMCRSMCWGSSISTTGTTSKPCTGGVKPQNRDMAKPRCNWASATTTVWVWTATIRQLPTGIPRLPSRARTMPVSKGLEERARLLV